MPNIGALLKEEIARLSRRELRRHVEGLKKASAQHRRHIAALKRQVAALERALARQARNASGGARKAAGEPADGSFRFVAKGLRSQRKRLGLSAAEYGRLVGVSAQSVYNWERETAKPRNAQLAAVAALRGVGKREAAARLTELGAKREPAKRARARRSS